MADRIRLSDRARKRLTTLSDQADLEPSFLLEFLINRYGNEAIASLTGQQGSLVTLTDTNGSGSESIAPKVTSSDPVVASTPTVQPTEKSPLDALAAMNFDD
jgi:hypothetical protein